MKIIYKLYHTIHQPPIFSLDTCMSTFETFYFCNKLAFWIVGNCSTLFKCSWCAINKGSLLLHWVKNCWSSARYCGFLEILIKEGEDFCFLNTIHHLLKSLPNFLFLMFIQKFVTKSILKLKLINFMTVNRKNVISSYSNIKLKVI